MTKTLVPKYIDPQRVAEDMMLRDSEGNQMYFSVSTVPTETMVSNSILAAEEYIDSYTFRTWRDNQTYTENCRVPPHFGRYDAEFFVYITHFPIKTLTSLKISFGADYEEWVGSKSVGRGNEYSIDLGSEGIIILRGANFNTKFTRARMPVKATYTYGESDVPNDIMRACSLIVQKDILRNTNYSVVIPDNSYNVSLRDKISMLDVEIKEILNRYRRIRGV